MEVNNMYITYTKLTSLIIPYFVMNGGEDFMTGGELDMIVNLAVQDLLNSASFSFMAEFDHIKDAEDYLGLYTTFTTKHPINKIHELILDGEGDDATGDLVNTMPPLNSDSIFFKKGTNIIYCKKGTTSLMINYEKDYEPVNGVNASDTLLPVPFTYVPALIKLIYDHAAPFNFYQGDSSAGDFYGHFNTRRQELINSDIMTTNHSVSIGGNL